MAAEGKVKNVVHEMTIWKQVIDTELRTAAEWEENWGFLKAQRRMPRRQQAQGPSAMAQTAPADFAQQGASSPTFKGAGRSVLEPMSARSAPVRMGDTGDDRQRVLSRWTKTPKERFARPITTTQELGWRCSLEKFGVNHHGIRRSAELWPEV
mmetsp:Transcript_77297/g.136941  ORF Transcript_77297/g.136941 Transcript_77297/m.136941 type:complete len:153 (-) Transcript_77297:77-535(-)